MHSYQVRNVLSQHWGRQETNMPPPHCRGCVYFWSLTLGKLQTARGRDHSWSEASTIILWVSPFPAVFSERKRSLWNTEFKLIFPFYTFWITPDKPAKRYALLLNHFQQDRKGHRTFILRPIRAWGAGERFTLNGTSKLEREYLLGNIKLVPENRLIQSHFSHVFWKKIILVLKLQWFRTNSLWK